MLKEFIDFQPIRIEMLFSKEEVLFSVFFSRSQNEKLTQTIFFNLLCPTDKFIFFQSSDLIFSNAEFKQIIRK